MFFLRLFGTSEPVGSPMVKLYINDCLVRQNSHNSVVLASIFKRKEVMLGSMHTTHLNLCEIKVCMVMHGWLFSVYVGNGKFECNCISLTC